jgi:hypothetical protein
MTRIGEAFSLSWLLSDQNETSRVKESNVNSFDNSSKFVIPVNPYTIDSPQSNKPDERAPKIKYFNPASAENSLFL